MKKSYRPSKSALLLLAALHAAASGGRRIDPARIAPKDAETLLREDLARRDGASLVVTDAGRARPMRQSAHDAVGAFRAQHLDLVRRLVKTDHGHTDALVDDSESPLRTLAKRKGKGGEPLITPMQEQAGERLRGDFTRAQLTPRVTSSWDPSTVRGPKGQSGGASVTDVAIAAKQTVRDALDVVGPEFAGLLLDVCCFLKGLEEVERERRWPSRSAKVVLQLALDRLARHYGLAGEARGKSRAPIRRWDDSEEASAAI